MEKLLIVTGANPTELGQFAAGELQRYAQRLFGIRARIAAATEPAKAVVFLEAGAAGLQPPADDQVFVLRRLANQGRPGLLAVGGSPAATLWAVYELVERWGVKYLLRGDLFPERAGEFHLPEINVAMTPNLRVRCLGRFINDFACGPESWGLAENRRFIDQLAKLKFNDVYLELWPYQSHVHYEFRSIQKRTGLSWYGYRYPIDADTVGREIFGGASEFANPDLAGLRDYAARHAAARDQARGILQHACRRGMTTGIAAQIFEYPLEFRSVLPGMQEVEQVGHLSCGPGADQDPDDPVLQELVRTVIRAHVQTFPEADYLCLRVPEHRAWMNRAEDAWQKLDRDYGISEVMTLAEAVSRAQKRTQVHGGAQRQVTRVLADVVALRLLDQVLADDQLLARPGQPPARVIYSFLAEELLPIVPKLRRPTGGLMIFTDYTARRVVDQIAALDDAPADRLPCRMIFTLADDNIGPLPQLATRSLHTLASRIRQKGWAGFSPRYWLIGDLDPAVQYLARSSWEADVTPAKAYADLALALCASDGVAPLVQAWGLVEDVTDAFDRHGINLAFPVPGMMMKYWDAAHPLAEPLRQARHYYERACGLVQTARQHAKLEGKAVLDYLVGRLQFAVRYMDAVAFVGEAAAAEKAGHRAQATAELQKAFDAIHAALQVYAAVAADNSDRGAVAVMNEYCHRPIRDKLAELVARRKT